jgi:hypothetical protein
MYFKEFPSLSYIFPGKSIIDLESRFHRVLTDITKNVRVRKDVLENILLYDEYTIKDGETLESIAYKYYGNAEYHWIIMLVNQIYNYVTDLPMTTEDFNRYIMNTYGEDKQYSIRHYEENGIEVTPSGYYLVNPTIIDNFKPGDLIYSVSPQEP